MKVLYVTGTDAEGPDPTAEQLARVSPDLEITAVPSAAEALQEARTKGGVRALVTSHRLASRDVLSVITTLRKERIPTAVVPVLTEDQRELFTSAVAAGADDVLMLRGETLLAARETLGRLILTDGFRLRVLYAGADDQVWRLLEQVPFATAERATPFAEGANPWRVSGNGGKLRCDALVVDQQPNGVHPLHIVKSARADVTELPVVVLVPSDQMEVETAAFDLGADDAIVKGGLYRRRLISTLRRLYQRAHVLAQLSQLRRRESRLRQLVETLPQSVGIIDEELSISAMNIAAIALFGASKPTDVVGRDFRTLVATEDRERMSGELERILADGHGEAAFQIGGENREPRKIGLRAIVLEQDQRGRRAIAAVFSTEAAPDESAMTGRLDDLAAQHARELHDLDDRQAAERGIWEAQRQDWASERQALERRLTEEETRKNTLAASAESDRAFRLEAESTIGRLEEEVRVARRLGDVGSLAVAMAPEILERVTGKASILVKQLVTFNRRQTAPPDRVDLSEAVARIEPALPRLIGSAIEVETKLQRCGPVLQSTDDIDSLLISLATAGRDLLPLGGLLRIETDQQQGDAVVAITAEGYGVTPAQVPESVENLARRFGGSVRVATAASSEAKISVHLPVGGADL